MVARGARRTGRRAAERNMLHRDAEQALADIQLLFNDKFGEGE